MRMVTGRAGIQGLPARILLTSINHPYPFAA
jgi:hypothetical protein